MILFLITVIFVSLTFGFISKVATSSWIPFLGNLIESGVVIFGVIIRHIFNIRDILNERSKEKLYCNNSKTKSLHEFYLNNGELQLDHFHSGSLVFVGKDEKSFTVDSDDFGIVISNNPTTLKFDTNNIMLFLQKGVV